MTISKKLKEKDLVRHWWSFYLLGQLSAQDKLTKVKWGEYPLSRGLSPREILNRLLQGDVVFHEVRVVPGSTLKDIAKLMAKTGLTTEREALAAFDDRGLIIKLHIPSVSFEGYLFPETYRFTRPQTHEHMITTMVEQGQKQVTEEMNRRAGELGFTWHQVMTLASIVEKETGNPADRKKIASVFYNRYKIGMPLQSDPTVIYGIPNFNGNLTKEDLRTPSLYNTYVNTGLPPTPICSPSLEAIDATLYPEDTEFLYFVSRNNGSSQFSATYKEHLQAVRQYQLRRTIPKDKNLAPLPPS
jgi:UPF0755 protein